MGNSININVSDSVGQRNLALTDVPADASWGETLTAILGKMNLPANIPANNSGDGEEAIWSGRLERDGRHLHNSEIVGDALENGDHVTIERDINAGGLVTTRYLEKALSCQATINM